MKYLVTKLAPLFSFKVHLGAVPHCMSQFTIEMGRSWSGCSCTCASRTRLPPCRRRVSNKSPDQCSEISKHQLQDVALPASHRGTRRACCTTPHPTKWPASAHATTPQTSPIVSASRILVNLRETTNFMHGPLRHPRHYSFGREQDLQST